MTENQSIILCSKSYLLPNNNFFWKDTSGVGTCLLQNFCRSDSSDHEPILKIPEIKAPASSAPLEAAECEECSLNTLV